MVPPPALGEVLVDRARRVLADVFLRNGHSRRDWLRSGSIAMIDDFLMSVERFEIISLMACLFFAWGGGKDSIWIFLSCPKLLRMMERLREGWMDGRGGRCIKGGRKTAGGRWKQQEEQDEVTPDGAAGSIDN